MKKYLFAFLLVTGICGAALACGDDKENKDSTHQRKSAQTGNLAPDLDIPVAGSWQRSAISRDMRQAVYLHRDLRKSLFFSRDNSRALASMEQVGAGTLPGHLKRKLRRNYKGYRIAQVIRYHDGETLYFVSLTKDQEKVLLSFAQ